MKGSAELIKKPIIRKNADIRKTIQGDDNIARQKREWYKGATLHVMARGVRKQSIYRADEDFMLFRMVIKETMEQYPFQLLCYCLMTNHFHMLLRTEDVEIWKIMNRIMSNYARTYNQKYGYTGHLFDSRYVSKIVEDDKYLLEVSRYIHMNPVKAKMVRNPADYEQSSYRNYLGLVTEDILFPETIQNMFQKDPYAQYKNFVEGSMLHDDMECRIQKEMREDDNWLPW